MSRRRFSVSLSLCLGCVALLISGCPAAPDFSDTPAAGTALLATPETLDFGLTTNQVTLTIRTPAGTVDPGPLTIRSDAAWVAPQDCTGPSDGCLPGDPGDVQVAIVVDRSITQLGENEATLTISADGASVQTVTVSLDDDLVTDFTANTRTVQVDDPVQLSAQVATLASAGPVTGFFWTFGDGGTSTEQNPTYSYEAVGFYRVALTATTAQREETLVREAFINVVPSDLQADFTAQPRQINAGQSVTFTDDSAATRPILSRTWDFGDGTVLEGNDTSPTHTYSSPGVFDVTLTVATDEDTDSITKPGFISVVQPTRPTAAFELMPPTPRINETVQFVDISSPGSTPITEWFWDFGNGETSTQQNPSTVYTSEGPFTVSLTVTNAAGSDTATRSNIVVEVDPPNADFSVAPDTVFIGDTVQFTDLSTAGSLPIVDYLWDFGDGNTSDEPNPAHVYQETGAYDVTLTVTSQDPGKQLSNSITKEMAVAVDRPRPIDDFMADTADPTGMNRGSFPFRTPGFEVTRTDLLGGVLHVVRMTSQNWRASDVVYTGSTPTDTKLAKGTEPMAPEADWEHWVSIIEPDIKVSDTALLLITGGSFDSARPTDQSIDDFLVEFAKLTGTVICVINNVPGQPLVFEDELTDVVADPNSPDSGLIDNGVIRTRSEDAIIAYTFDKYLETFTNPNQEPDESWPVLFPMTRAAIRAMDFIQEEFPNLSFKPDDNDDITDFVLAGGSKRGWATWLTAASDPQRRVKAIIPIVIDVLNMREQMENHFSSYGYWSPSIYDYAQEQIFDRLLQADTQPETEALLDLVDPFTYRNRLTMPKFVVNSTGDQFFLPDSSNFYFDQLVGDRQLHYAPNTDHGLDNSFDFFDDPTPLSAMLAYYLSVVQDIERPTIDWSFEPDGSIEVETSEPPSDVIVWSATNPNGRDFRLQRIGAAWTPSFPVPLSPTRFSASVPTPDTGYTAFFVQVFFDNPATFVINDQLGEVPPFIVSTDVRVTPEGFPEFPGTRDDLPDVLSPIEGPRPGASVLQVWGDPFTMGRDIGQLMGAEIRQFIPRYIAAATTENDLITPAALQAAWDNVVAGGFVDQRIIDELAGMAEGAQISLSELQQANAVQFFETYESASVNYYEEAAINRGSITGYANSQNLLRITQYFPTPVVYVPDRGFPHVLFTYAGLVTAPFGANVAGIALSEDGSDKETLPFDPNFVNRFVIQQAGGFPQGSSHFLLDFRKALYDSASLREALSFLDTQPRALTRTLLIHDGRNETRAVKILRAPTVGIGAGFGLGTAPGGEPFGSKIISYNNAQNDPLLPFVRSDLVYSSPDAAPFNLFLSEEEVVAGPTLSDFWEAELERVAGLSQDNIISVAGDIQNFFFFYQYELVPGRGDDILDVQSRLP